MRFFIPSQLKRLGLVFAIFIGAFLILRHYLIPDTFGQYGFYRGAALNEISQSQLKFAGQKACLECHQDIEDLKKEDVHSDISCESCHGPGLRHTENGDTTLLDLSVSRESCGICHSQNDAKRKETIFQVNLKEHNVGKKCIECHNPHKPWEMKK
jgi:hypothetical protein